MKPAAATTPRRPGTAQAAIVAALAAIDGDADKLRYRTFRPHLGGKIELSSRTPRPNPDDLSMGILALGRVAMAIARPDAAATMKWNSVAVATTAAGPGRHRSTPRCPS